MLDRSRQGIAAPAPIVPEPHEAERLRVLRHIAAKLPEIARRRNISMIGKGGTMLALVDGLTRPSTDYDADVDQPLGKRALQQMIGQVLRTIPGVERLNVEWLGRRTDAVTFAWNARGMEEPVTSFLNVTTRTPDAVRRQAWQLTGPAIKDAMVREVDGMPVYTMPELMRGKASAFMNRAKARDTYDVAWAFATRLDEIDADTRVMVDRFIKHGTSDEQWNAWEDDYRDDDVMSRAPGLDDALGIISDCLETDPVVRVAREPHRDLAFWIDETHIGLHLTGLPDDAPKEYLYRVPRTEIEELAGFLIASGADLTPRLGLGPEDLRREGGTGVTRIIANGIATFEQEQAKARTP